MDTNLPVSWPQSADGSRRRPKTLGVTRPARKVVPPAPAVTGVLSQAPHADTARPNAPVHNAQILLLRSGSCCSGASYLARPWRRWNISQSSVRSPAHLRRGCGGNLRCSASRWTISMSMPRRAARSTKLVVAALHPCLAEGGVGRPRRPARRSGCQPPSPARSQQYQHRRQQAERVDNDAPLTTEPEAVHCARIVALASGTPRISVRLNCLPPGEKAWSPSSWRPELTESHGFLGWAEDTPFVPLAGCRLPSLTSLCGGGEQTCHLETTWCGAYV